MEGILAASQTPGTGWHYRVRSALFVGRHSYCRRLSRGIVPIDERGNVILVGQYRFPLDAYSWEIPEGGGLPPTSILDSAKRELVEECGVSARCWTEILEMDLSNSVSDEHATAFLAWDLTNATADPEGTEQLQIARVPFWEAVERVKRGEIRDSLSVASLLRVALMALQDDLPKSIANLLAPR